jgi:hypothetical protein
MGTTATKKAPAKTASAKPATLVIEPGTILSETSFYVVEEVQQGKVIVSDDFGHKITLGMPYVKEITICADFYEKEEEKSMTELADLLVNSPRIAMTVAYITKASEKTKRDFDLEKSAKIAEIQNASLKNASALLSDLIENPITKAIPGKLRVMKGRHYGNVDDLGRVHFIDMEIKRDTTKDYDTRSRQVDPRTIQYLIINKVKYTLK